MAIERVENILLIAGGLLWLAALVMQTLVLIYGEWALGALMIALNFLIGVPVSQLFLMVADERGWIKG